MKKVNSVLGIIRIGNENKLASITMSRFLVRLQLDIVMETNNLGYHTSKSTEKLQKKVNKITKGCGISSWQGESKPSKDS